MKPFDNGVKTRLRHAAAMITALICAAMFMFTGCEVDVLRPENHAFSEPFLDPPQFTLSEDDYTIEEKRVLYPEGADDDTAQYVLTYSIPVFSENIQLAADMNTGIAMFEAELMKRVEDERLPYADRVEGQEMPYTSVTCEVSSARGFVNTVFTEKFGYGGDDEQTMTITVVMRDGKRVGLSAASGAYDAQERAAQQILNMIAENQTDITYYNDLILDDAVSAIDLYSGFYAVDSGYTLICREGILAPAEYGEILLTVSTESLYPDVVGDLITIDEYEALTPVIDCLAYAAYTNSSSFASGNPDSVLSTAFMLSLVSRTNAASNAVEVLEDGSLLMDRDAFSGIFSSLFDTRFPGTAQIAQGSVEETDDGYLLSPANTDDGYRFALSDVTLSGDILMAVGEIMYGDPDGTNSRLCAVEITLRRSETSPIGFKLVSLEFN